MDKVIENKIREFMAAKLAEGLSLSDIQNEVNREFQQQMTYMEVRILASTLEVDWQAMDPKRQNAAPEVETAAAVSEADAADAEEAFSAEAETEPDPETAVPGKEKTVAAMESLLAGTKVEISKLARPGMAFSGSATFANGATAEWYVDDYGRLGLENLQGNNPSPQEIQAFQIVLQKTVRKMMGQGGN